MISRLHLYRLIEIITAMFLALSLAHVWSKCSLPRTFRHPLTRHSPLREQSHA